jgi:hypothetical protein
MRRIKKRKINIIAELDGVSQSNKVCKNSDRHRANHAQLHHCAIAPHAQTNDKRYELNAEIMEVIQLQVNLNM